MLKTEEIHVRDPYVALHHDTYYLYATTGETVCSCYKSKDLVNWEDERAVFCPVALNGEQLQSCN